MLLDEIRRYNTAEKLERVVGRTTPVKWVRPILGQARAAIRSAIHASTSDSTHATAPRPFAWPESLMGRGNEGS